MTQLEKQLPDGGGSSSLQGAMTIIREFCENFSEPEIQERMLLAAKTCLTADVPDFAKALDRQDIRYVFEQVSVLFHAVYDLNACLK